MNNTDNTFIASQVQTLEDLLKTNLCHGKNIYCQFDESEFSPSLQMLAEQRGVNKVLFMSKETQQTRFERFEISGLNVAHKD